MSGLRAGLIALGLIGAMVFVTGWLLSFAMPHTIETAARSLMVGEVKRRTHERLDQLSDGALVELAQRTQQHRREEAGALDRMRAALPQRVQSTVEAMLDPECPCRQSPAVRRQPGLDWRMAALDSGNARLEMLIQNAYTQTAARLLREFRIFSGGNAVVFVVLAMLAWRRPAASVHLLLPAAVLLGGTLLAAGLYLFGQNWLQVVLFDHYVGYAYLAWLAPGVLACLDIAFNRGRATALTFNAMSNALGSAVQIAPC